MFMCIHQSNDIACLQILYFYIYELHFLIVLQRCMNIILTGIIIFMISLDAYLYYTNFL